MQLTPRRHELLCAYLLGFGTLFQLLGYTLQSFIGEAVIHSVHEREPNTISQYAGYYGQAVHYSAFAICSILSPSVKNFLASKWMLTISAVLYGAYYLGFVHINSIYFYLSQALVGVGYALFNNGEGAYLSEHSSRRTIESNTGIETAVGHASMFVGGLCLYGIFFVLPHSATAGLALTEPQIRILYLALFAINVFAIVIFALLPTKQYDSIASKATTVLPSFKNQIKMLGKTFAATNMILLMPFCFHMGLIVSFLMSIYPTSLSFSSAIRTDIYTVAIYSVGLGAAEICGGIFLRPLIKRSGRFGLLLTMTMHSLFTICVIALVFCGVPEWATIRPTELPARFIQPSRLMVALTGFLLGMEDFSITMARAVICQAVVPECRMEVFSISRIYQCVSSCVVLVLSPYMTVTVWCITLSVSLLAGCASFVAVERMTLNARKATVIEQRRNTIIKKELEHEDGVEIEETSQ